jgi:hypothetical protein
MTLVDSVKYVIVYAASNHSPSIARIVSKETSNRGIPSNRPIPAPTHVERLHPMSRNPSPYSLYQPARQAGRHPAPHQARMSSSIMKKTAYSQMIDPKNVRRAHFISGSRSRINTSVAPTKATPRAVVTHR